MKVVVLKTAKDIPDEWDSLAYNNLFIKRNSLSILEEVNPCGQQYHLFYSDKLDSIMVTYQLKIDIFTYSRLRFKLPITVIGIPASVSESGFVLGEETIDLVERHVALISGGKLLLNADDTRGFSGFAKGHTLPTHKLAVRWKSFDEYLSSIRSHYRYRINAALKKREMLHSVELHTNELFDDDLYNLYLNVYQKSEFKLEKLSIEFFRRFPSRIFKFESNGKTAAFVQLAKNHNNLIFLFGGIDYSLNARYDLYLNMLIKIIQVGISEGCDKIEFGQTAEDTKLKLGSKSYSKFMYVSHSSAVLNYIISKSINLLGYKEKDIEFNVFRHR